MATKAAQPLSSPAERAYAVKEEARRLGFQTSGITDLSETPHAAALDRWLAQGMAGTMRYMHRQRTRRLTPATILQGASRAVMVTRNYFTPDPNLRDGEGRVAKYARGRDYHTALSRPLRQLAAFVRGLGPAGSVARTFVDSGPVPERELAQRAGLGWIGKNTML